MRTKLRGKVTLLFMMLGLLVAIPAVALADIVTVTNETQVNGDTTKAPGATGQARVYLTNTNQQSGGGDPTNPNYDDVNACNAAGSGNQVSITLGARNPTTLVEDTDITFTTAPQTPPVAGQNPAVITDCDNTGTTDTIEGLKEVNYQVAANAPNKVVEIYVKSISGGRAGSDFNKNDTLRVTINNPNTAPTVPGVPSGTSPNQGLFTLDWDDSTDAQNNPITYTLQHKDSNDADFSPVASGISGSSYTFGSSNAEAEGTWTYRVSASDGSLSSAFSAASSPIKVDKSNPYEPTFDPGTPAYNPAGTADDWYRDSATVQFSNSTTTTNGDRDLQDTSAGSGVASLPTTPDNINGAITLNTAGANSFSGRTVDVVGLQSNLVSGSVNVDTQDPTVSFTNCPTTDVVKGSSVTANWTASDPGASANPVTGSGLSASSPTSGSVTLDTSSIGSKTANVAADTVQDKVGHNSDEATCNYNVIYDFSGFFQPIDNKDPDTGNYIPNKAKAGSVIPVKFSLGGDQGLDIFYTGDLPKIYPTVVGATGCATGTADLVEVYAPANASGLKYDPLANQYIYNWKTQSSYVGKCLMLNVKLADGETYSALFTFTK